MYTYSCFFFFWHCKTFLKNKSLWYIKSFPGGSDSKRISTFKVSESNNREKILFCEILWHFHKREIQANLKLHFNVKIFF